MVVNDSLPNKALGQHWLYDKAILQEMADSAYVSRAACICEIGPGLGTLTALLLEKGLPLVAIEFDKELAKELPSRFTAAEQERLRVVDGDVRTFNFNSLPAPYVISANIPYYLTSHLLRILTEIENQPLKAALLMQKEVAERIAARPGKMGLLSCVTQFHYDVSLGSIVPAILFSPPPKVDSRILILQKRAPLFDADWNSLLRLFKAGFSEKRKNLRNALSGGLRIEKSAAENILYNARINSARRAESLSMKEWQSLYEAQSLLDSLRK